MMIMVKYSVYYVHAFFFLLNWNYNNDFIFKIKYINLNEITKNNDKLNF